MPYQDVWSVKLSKAIAKGQRECESRYFAIRSFLLEFGRPFTVLDIGASEGYFSFRIAQDFPQSTVVAIEGTSRLLPLCYKNNLPNVIHLKHRLGVHDLEDLVACEHFDLVLAMNVLHHFPAPDRTFAAIMGLGDHTIIETPPPEDSKACGQHNIPYYHALVSKGSERPEGFERLEGCIIAKTPSHVTKGVSRNLWLFQTPKLTLTKAFVDVPDISPICHLSIVTDRHQKTVELKGTTREWIEGINLRTYQVLGGLWPLPTVVCSLLRQYQLPKKEHGDVKPWNFILSGQHKVTLIDDEGGGDGKAIYTNDPYWLDLVANSMLDVVVKPVKYWITGTGTGGVV